MDIKSKIYSRLAKLYGENVASECLERLEQLFSSYGFTLEQNANARRGWDEKDSILITYGDVVNPDGRSEEQTLKTLEIFLNEYLGDVISTVHILPFFPSSSDGGFSVIDYKQVRDDLGSWNNIEELSKKYQVMADLVINHTSRFSKWFENYQKNETPGKDYFLEMEEGIDLSGVTRPRNSPLLSTVETRNGMRHVWTTFSDDQVDLNFTNPDVLFEFIDIFLFYYQQGISVIRLDAIAYLWKKVGTKSIHLEETHQIVKLFRDLAECIDPDITLITETNVPFEENISYFGDRDEAHMIYQFSLPPLLLHAIHTENAEYLTKWASALPALPEDCTYFNFTASHDGIGVRPLEGLVPDEDFDYLIECTEERGGFVSYKNNPDGGQSPYELNITYFDAFEQPGDPRTDLQMKRYMCSQVLMLSLQGIPGIYFHNLMATKNYMKGVLETGKKRDINRRQWQWDELIELIEDPERINHEIFNRYIKLLKKRKQHPAFHPRGRQDVFNIDGRFFAFLRTAPDKSERILVISNVTDNDVEVRADDFEGVAMQAGGVEDLLSERVFFKSKSLTLKPFQTVWLRVE